MASKLKLNEVVLQSPNGLVEKSISMGDDGVVKVNGVQVADIVSGTFTPVIRGETTAGTATYTTQQGIYSKIGRVVHFQIYLNWDSLTGTGAMIITGLPFANGSVIGAVTVSYPNLIALPAGGVLTAHIVGSVIYLTSYPAGGGGMSFVQCDARGELILSGSYITA